MTTDSSYQREIDPSIASDAVRPMLEELINCFTYEQGEDVGAEWYQEMENPYIIIRVDDKLDDVLERIGNTQDISAVPFLIKMLILEPGTDKPFMDWQTLYRDAMNVKHNGRIACPSLWHMHIKSRQSSPNIYELKNQVIGTLKEIAEHAPDSVELFAEYPTLRTILNHYAAPVLDYSI